ncbi:MAG TPA: hypothetical protein VK031_09765 [Tissierellaceae bacterium]|nr:hypothetical protein [Tissierellaceae bacterium]
MCKYRLKIISEKQSRTIVGNAGFPPLTGTCIRMYMKSAARI